MDDYTIAIAKSVQESTGQDPTVKVMQFDQWSADWITNAARFSSQAYDQACIQSETLSELKAIVCSVDTRDLTTLPEKWQIDDTIVHAQKKLESMSVGLKIWKQTHYKLKRQVELEEYLYTNNAVPLARVGLRNQLKAAKSALARHEASNEEYIRLGDVDQYISDIMKQSSDYDDRTESFLEKLSECGCISNTNMDLVLDNEHIQSTVGLIKYIEKLMNTIMNLIVKLINDRRKVLRTDVMTMVPNNTPVPYQTLSDHAHGLRITSNHHHHGHVPKASGEERAYFNRYQTMRDQAYTELTDKTTDIEKTTEVRLSRLVNHLSIMVHTIPFVSICINNYLNDYMNRAYYEVQRTATAVEATALAKQAVNTSIANTNNSIKRVIHKTPMFNSRQFINEQSTDNIHNNSVTDKKTDTTTKPMSMANWWLGSTLSSLLNPPQLSSSLTIVPTSVTAGITSGTGTGITGTGITGTGITGTSITSVPNAVAIPSEPPLGELDPTIDYVYMLWYEGYPERTYIPYIKPTTM
jgi:hypothetical protein